MMIILRETTKWTECPHEQPNHDYLVDDNHEFLIAYRKEGGTEWEKFSKRRPFLKTRRRFKELNEEIPTNFVKPFMSDPWKKKEYNSLEMFM